MVPSVCYNAHIFLNSLLQGLETGTWHHVAITFDRSRALQTQQTTPQTFKYDTQQHHCSFLRALQEHHLVIWGEKASLSGLFHSCYLCLAPLTPGYVPVKTKPCLNSISDNPFFIKPTRAGSGSKPVLAV